jgi:hypothetical protein
LFVFFLSQQVLSYLPFPPPTPLTRYHSID